MWVQNGVHCAELGTSEGSPLEAEPALLRAFLTRHADAPPAHIVPAFQW